MNIPDDHGKLNDDGGHNDYHERKNKASRKKFKILRARGGGGRRGGAGRRGGRAGRAGGGGRVGRGRRRMEESPAAVLLSRLTYKGFFLALLTTVLI